MGVDWADQSHEICVVDEQGERIKEQTLTNTVDSFSAFGRWLYECTADGLELWAAIEKPEGRIIDFLLDHGVLVYPINPKSLDRARDRFRVSRSKSDAFDAWVLAQFLRTDHAHLSPLCPNSPPAAELKLLTRDYQKLVQQKTRWINQLKATLKEYYPRPLELFELITCPTALDFLQRYPTPEKAQRLTKKQWRTFAQKHRWNAGHLEQVWQILRQPQLPIAAHVVRAKARLMIHLVDQLRLQVHAIEDYKRAIEQMFAALPAATWAQSLPGGKSGTTLPTLWAELGDAVGRWHSFRHLQAQAGTTPVTRTSGKFKQVHFRFACNKVMRYAINWMAQLSLQHCEWAKVYYDRQRARGHSHQQAIRALGAKWLKIIFIMWRDHVSYDETFHLANIARQEMRQAISA